MVMRDFYYQQYHGNGKDGPLASATATSPFLRGCPAEGPLAFATALNGDLPDTTLVLFKSMDRSNMDMFEAPSMACCL